jgi:hypothetical protein
VPCKKRRNLKVGGKQEEEKEEGEDNEFINLVPAGLN